VYWPCKQNPLQRLLKQAVLEKLNGETKMTWFYQGRSQPGAREGEHPLENIFPPPPDEIRPFVLKFVIKKKNTIN